MRTFPLFAIFFFVIPLLEIYFLIQVGGVIGALPTIILVVLTAVIGAFLLKQQGISTLARFQSSMAQGQMPATALLEGVMLIIGGALLMTPGFFTDAIGFACLLPFSRQWLAGKMVSRFSVGSFGSGQASGFQAHTHAHSDEPHTNAEVQRSGGNTLDGDYSRKD